MNVIAPYLMIVLTRVSEVGAPRVQCVSNSKTKLNNNFKASVFYTNKR